MRTLEQRGTGVVRMDNIVKAEGIGVVGEGTGPDVRYCRNCGAIITKGGGYLLQGSIPAWAASMNVLGFSSAIGSSCEHRDGDHTLAIWYWYCNVCGSLGLAQNRRLVNGAPEFWRTGQPPKRPPIIA
jgi:hypothetical protein